MEVRHQAVREAEARIVGRIAHQDDGGMAAQLRLGQACAHQCRADALALRLAVDRERPEQQRRAGGTRDHVPQADGADEPALRVHRGEGEAFRRQAAFAQALGGLAAARLAEGTVEQALARAACRRRFRGGW